MVVAPQFLTRADTRAFSLPAPTLAWTQEGWKGGEPARQPAPISSFTALDALLAHFADRGLYPALSTVVVIGHSAGAQLLQRYAVAGHEGDALARAGIAVRMWSRTRRATCISTTNGRTASRSQAEPPERDRMEIRAEVGAAYVASQDVRDLETRYAARHVVYLLGGRHEPLHPLHRPLMRGHGARPVPARTRAAYFDYLKKRHPDDLAQQVVEAPGVGHDGSACSRPLAGWPCCSGRRCRNRVRSLPARRRTCARQGIERACEVAHAKIDRSETCRLAVQDDGVARSASHEHHDPR